MNNLLKSLRVSASDYGLFKHLLKKEGISVLSRHKYDDLDRNVKLESILSISSIITEDVNTRIDITNRQKSIMKLARNLGYIVAIEEGLDQMPGTDIDPIRSILRSKSDDSKDAGENGDEQEDTGKDDFEDIMADDGEPNEDDLPIK